MNEHLPENGVRDKALRVLLLEDSRFDAELLREALLAAFPHARLEVVRDEPEFSQAIATRRYDLILSDFELPGFTGEQCFSQQFGIEPRIFQQQDPERLVTDTVLRQVFIHVFGWLSSTPAGAR